MWAVIGISTAIALAGVVAGAKVQRVAKFIYPYDALTLTIAGFCIADTIAGMLPTDKFWYLPLLLGYATGYLVVGRTGYTMVQTVSLGDKVMDCEPWVFWQEDGRTYTQEQTNRALLRRLLFGIKHEVVSNTPLDKEWTVNVKVPMFPLITKPTVMAEDVVTSWSPVRVFWRFTSKRYVTEITMAYAGMVTKAQLSQDERFLQVMQRQNTDLVAEVHELTSQQGPKLMEMALRLEHEIDSKAPVNRMYDLIRFGKERRKEDADETEAADPAE